jgi:general secretion pathway protein G
MTEQPRGPSRHRYVTAAPVSARQRSCLRRPRQDERGFTLIELLIVIVILGILAAIVVFAVNGIQDRGTASACKADVETVTVAAEAYDAQNGRYADSMDELVSAGLLHSVPSSKSYSIDYSVSGEGDNQRVSVSSTSCPDATAGGPSSGGPTTDDPDQNARYCEALASAEQRFQGLSLSALDVDQFARAEAIFDEVRQVAPEQVYRDWKILVGTLDEMRQVVVATGLSRDDLMLLSNGQLPDGFSREQADQLNADVQAPLEDGRFQQAAQEIGEHANRTCNFG